MTYLNLELNKSSFCLCLILTCTMLWISCGREKSVVDVYESNEFKSIDSSIIKSGESVWLKACFRCHLDGTNDATSLQNKEYWNNSSSKGMETLFLNVWNGFQGENGMMPPKGFCNICTEQEIKNSILYLFHLSKKVHMDPKVIAPDQNI